MPDPKRPAHEVFGALLDASADEEQTYDEAAAELRVAGVDVEGFIGRLKVRLQAQADEERLSWLSTARQGMSAVRAPRALQDYRGLDRQALIARVTERQAQVGFHKLEEQTDDDLRSMLMDLDELDDDKDKT